MPESGRRCLKRPPAGCRVEIRTLSCSVQALSGAVQCVHVAEQRLKLPEAAPGMGLVIVVVNLWWSGASRLHSDGSL
eukprot:10856567-Alexandrium_andersonii.AAC.1